MLFPTNANQVQAFAGALYGVQVGSVTMAQVTSDITSGGGLNAVLNRYYSASFGSMTTTAVATSFATNLGLTGAALTEGVAYTTARLNAVAADARGAVISDILNLFSTLTADATFGAAATAWTTKVTAAAAYTGTTNVAIGTVVADSGGIFALTAGTDNLTGTSGDDTFNAVIQAAGATGTTIQPGDVINGGLGTDTLNIAVAGALAADFTLSAVQTNSVEKVLVNNFGTGAGNNIIDTALMSGLTTVGLSASSADGDTVFTGMNAIVAAEMSNGAGDLNLTYNAAAVVGTADSQTLNVSNLSAGTFTANGIETLNINSGLVKSTLAAVASNALKTVNVTGATDLTITAALDFASNGTAIAPGAVVNASTFTGKLNITTTAGEVLSVTGGSGDDTFNLGSLTKTDIVNGGLGNNTVSLAVGAVGDNFTQVTNIQNAVFTGGVAGSAIELDASKMGAVKNVVVDVFDSTDNGAKAAITVSKLSASQEVTVRRSTSDTGDDTGADDGVTLALTSIVNTANDAVKVNLSGIGLLADNDTVTTNQFGLDLLNVASFESVSIAANANAAGTVKTNQIGAVTATETKSIAITGAADLTLGTVTGSNVTSVDASAMTGKLVVTLGAMDASVKLADADSILTLADGSLNNKDTIVGGAGKDKLVVGAVTGLTATTGALNISGVETVELATTGANALNLAGVTGMQVLQVAGDIQTITGMDLATKLIATASGTLDVTAKDATGTNDTLTVEQKTVAGATTVVKAKGIENLALVINDTDTNVHTATFTLSDFEGQKIAVTQSATSLAASSNVVLGNLNKNITTVDTSGVKGTQSASAAASTAAVTFTLGGTAAAAITGSALADTFNIASSGAVVHAITGGAGVDTTNIAVKQGFVDPSAIATENLNITVNAGDSVIIAAGKAFNAASVDITLAGGNSLSSFSTLANANTVLADTVKTFDASKFAGNITVSVANDKLDETVTITGGALATDSVTATLATAGTYKPKTVGIESLLITADNGEATAAAYVLDLSSSTGVKTVVATVSDADTLTVDKITDQLIQVVSAKDDSIVEAKLVDASGAADSVSFELKGANANAIEDGFKLKTTDIETVNIKMSSAESISLADVLITEASKFVTLNVTGDKALTISALNADVNVINASGMTTGGSIIQTGRSGTTAANYTGTSGADTFIMGNLADVIVAGEGSDTLDINVTAVLGGIVVDLSAADVVVQANGQLNTTVQSGFINVDLAGYAGGFGAVVTANKAGSTITGTAATDQITGGAGADTINVATAGAANNDVMDGGAGANKLVLQAGSNTFAVDGNLVNIQTIDLIGTASVNLTNQTEGFTINGGAGINTIVSGSGADIITGGAGADIITVSKTGDTLKYTALTDSSSGATGIALLSGTTVVNNKGTNVGLDVVTFAATPATGDTLKFDFSFLGAFNVAPITMATTGNGLDGEIAKAVGILVGTTHADTGVFTSTGTAPTTSIIQVDTDAAAAGIISITLVGVPVTAAIDTGGILTLTF